MSCNNNIPNLGIAKCSPGTKSLIRKFTFKKGRCYEDGKYFGMVTARSEGRVTVRINNGNKYSKGALVEFMYFNNKEIVLPVADITSKRKKVKYCDCCGCLPVNCICSNKVSLT